MLVNDLLEDEDFETGHPLGWWLEVLTSEPDTYLFGPFETQQEVTERMNNYLADLVAEKKQILLTSVIKKEAICLLE